VGVAVGGRSPLGGWTVDAPMAESPAEEAGIRRGERILAVGVSDPPLAVPCFAKVHPAIDTTVQEPCLLPAPVELPRLIGNLRKTPFLRQNPSRPTI
jgi:hypothetical protein